MTIYNHKHSIPLSTIGFYHLKVFIASLISQDCANICKEEVCYGDSERALRRAGCSNLDEYQKANNLDKDLLSFLFRSLIDPTPLSLKECESLWKLIEKHDTNILFETNQDFVTFKEFKEIVKSSIDTNSPMLFFCTSQ